MLFAAPYDEAKCAANSIGCNSQEELDALDIRPGGRYLAFGADYIDRDLELRTTLAGTHRCSVEDIDLSKMVVFSPEEYFATGRKSGEAVFFSSSVKS